MLDQLDLDGSADKPNVIGNAEEQEQVMLVNLNTGRAKKVGLGAYDLEVRTNLPKMPKLTQKHELMTLPKTASSMGFSYKLALSIE